MPESTTPPSPSSSPSPPSHPSPPSSRTSASANHRGARAVALAYLNAFDRADPTEIAAHVSSTFVNEHTAALGSGCRGKDAYLERLPGFLRDMEGLQYDVERLVCENDDVAAFYTMTARFQGESPISVRGVMYLKVIDGLIDHRTDYWDSAVFLTQVSQDAREALRPFGVH